MVVTLSELQEKLKQVEETILLELLDISSEEIVDRFYDIIEEKYAVLVKEYEENEYDN